MESTTKGLAGALKEWGRVEGSSFVSAAASLGVQHEHWFLCATQRVPSQKPLVLNTLLAT